MKRSMRDKMFEMFEASFTDFGRMVQHQRLLYGMTKKDLAEKIGMSASLISLVENGRWNSRIKNFGKVCSALELTDDEILVALGVKPFETLLDGDIEEFSDRRIPENEAHPSRV